ncbi:MAG: L,D-transpeptidase family protein [Chloroflexota bacterium]|nr:L,D-transpeptidase family protein [Chloroflexota bacterium]
MAASRPNPAVPVPPRPPAPTRARLPVRLPAGTRAVKHRARFPWLIVLAVPAVVLLLTLVLATLGAVFILSSDSVLPGVRVAGIPLGNLSETEAAAQLAQVWQSRGIILRDGALIYPVQPDVIGLTLDANASAAAARDYGRRADSLGNIAGAAFGRVNIAPVVTLDRDVFAAGLATIAQSLETPARNAGVQFVNGTVQPRVAVNGRMIDIGATVAQVEAHGTFAFADGEIELVMLDVPPAMTDPTPVVEAARALLANPLTIRAYNPVTDETIHWSVSPEEWIGWLSAETDQTQPTGLALALDDALLRTWLSTRESELPAAVYLNADESITQLQAAIASSRTDATIRVYNRDRQYTVQAGDTITAIAWDYGVPYLYIEQANPGLASGLTIGQRITIPSADAFLELPIVFDKRIEVSISEQRVRVYENGAMKWDWIASTGITSSPTWTGVYQILSHEPNAYAGNWDLWMPNFMGVYRPIPSADFTNGFHGFPTRGGSQLLWTNSLGTRVTYGCILLGDENIRQLYEWAETGVVVEILP